MNYLSYQGKELPIVRHDIPGTSYPEISLFYKSTEYPYLKGFNLNLFLHFINRHLYPVAILNTVEGIDNFRNTTQEWTENTPFYNGNYRKLDDIFQNMEKVTRVIAFVAHKSEHKYELKLLSEAAKELGFRDDLRIAKVTDPKLVMLYKKKMGTQWFDEGSANSIIVFKIDGGVNIYDISSETLEMVSWINTASIEHVEKMNVFSIQIMEHLQMPIFTAFVDTNSSSKDSDKSLELLKILNKVAFDFPQYLIGYFDDHSYDARKESIGIESSNLPKFALFNPPENITVVFPEDMEISNENIRTFLKNGVKNTLDSKPIFEDEEEPKKVKKTKKNKSKGKKEPIKEDL
mmetsp:Transcript_19953/g.17631  ORF Transcript_19953/g.17631 Transcript_19953/m.17631 type:complete len:347 (+) Transcript_19953:360-1400(+)